MNDILKSYMAIIELMNDEKKFSGLLQDIVNYIEDHPSKLENFFDNNA